MEAANPPLTGFLTEQRQMQNTPIHASNGGNAQAESGAANSGDKESTNSNNDWVPRPKRIACVVCRKRKLRCDGRKPSCGTCSRLGHDCAYDEVRKKSGPKRGYVKQLEARLAQVETLLKTQDPTPNDAANKPSTSTTAPETSFNTPPLQNVPATSVPCGMDGELPICLDGFDNLDTNQMGFTGNSSNIATDFPWEMIGLGLEEPLPTQEVIDELNEIYFTKVNISMPLIHRPRYFAAMNLAPNMRPPVCLRYIMWCHAATVVDKYSSLHPHFYARARKYVELDQMKGLGESIVSVAHAQTWCLIAAYEFKLMYFPRAWLSTGQATRLALMMGLHRQDGEGLDVKQCLPPPRDWTEREERRRTFWIAFCEDRYASVGTGWPMMVDERDIMSNLPASDEAFQASRPQESLSLSEALSGKKLSNLSPFGGTLLLACLFGRNLQHVHRTTPNDKPHDLNGDFWKRHRALDNILLNTALSLPSHLRIPDGLSNPNVVFSNMCIHTSTICVHQAAIFKADKNKLPGQIAAESKRRCLIAADQITNIMKMISHMDLTVMNPFFAFCLYVAARVFIQYLRSRPGDQTVRSSLQFLLSAMNALKTKNPLTESFLVQLDVDLEASGLQNSPDRLDTGLATGVLRVMNECPGGSNPMNNLTGEDHVPVLNTSEPSNFQTTIPVSSAFPGSQTYFGTSCIGNDAFQDMQVTDFQAPHFNNDQIRSLVVEVDMSTENSTNSDRIHSGSEHATPSTNKSSSNSSFSPCNIDQPSPPKQGQQQQQQQQPRAPFKAPGNLYEATDPSTRQFSTTTTAPPAPETSIGLENPYSMQSSWNFPIRQPPKAGATPASSSSVPEPTFPTFEEMTWPQTPDLMNWSNWQT